MHSEVHGSSDFTEVERLVQLDIDDAFISERMARHLYLKMQSMVISSLPHNGKGLTAIQRALTLRFCLAVQRLLQGENGQKANLLAVLSAARSYIDQTSYNKFMTKLAAIRESTSANTLKDARNLFMAHTVIHPRDGSERFSIELPLDILFEAARFVEELHEAVHKKTTDAHKMYDLYNEIAPATWNLLLSSAEPMPDDID